METESPFECSACGEGFTGLKAFDAHLPPMVDGPRQNPCLEPTDVGLVWQKRDAAARHPLGWGSRSLP